MLPGTIDIHRAHALDQEQAKQLADELAARLARDFGLDYGWDGDCLLIRRPGLDGQIEVSDCDIHVTAKLGFLLSALQGNIESEVHRLLDKHFS